MELRIAPINAGIVSQSNCSGHCSSIHQSGELSQNVRSWVILQPISPPGFHHGPRLMYDRFLSSYSHVLQPEWNPTETDVIQCYVPTKSLSGAWISKDLIALEANTKHTTQKELSKIMPLVDGIVCVADISTLDYRYMVDPGKVSLTVPLPFLSTPVAHQIKSQFNESLGLLEEVLGSRGPQRKPIQLLLNKTDILRRKLKHLGVSLYSEGGLLQYFPGSAESVAKCFKEHLGYCDEYYLREICALDATWMNHIFKVWREMMFKSKLLAAGVM